MLATSEQHVCNISNIEVRQQFSSTENGRKAYAQYLADALTKTDMPTTSIRKYIEFFLLRYKPPCQLNVVEDEIELVLNTACFSTPDDNMSLTAKIKDWILQHNGNFKATNLYELATSATRSERAKEYSKIRAILSRLAKDDNPIIEKIPGGYRAKDAEIEKLDPFSCDGTILNVRYPLEIEKICRTMPKNIIVVAGEANSGKTSFLLNFARMNLNIDMPMRYMSSEMGNLELNCRLNGFKDTMGMKIDEWRKVDWCERSSDFQDIILPDGINIIDYLELPDEFYKAGSMLRSIFDRLDNGIAVIAMQKKTGSDHARGGEFTLEKPRIYITLENDPPQGNIAKIIKAKNFVRPDFNPNGRMCHFGTVNGSKIVKYTEWMYGSDFKKHKVANSCGV